jgi:hypothetical protein
VATIQSIGTGFVGNYSAAGAWVGGVPPTTGDTAALRLGDQITVTDSRTCDSVTFADNSTSLIVDRSAASGRLDVTGDITMNGGTTAAGRQVLKSTGGAIALTFNRLRLNRQFAGGSYYLLHIEGVSQANPSIWQAVAGGNQPHIDVFNTTGKLRRAVFFKWSRIHGTSGGGGDAGFFAGANTEMEQDSQTPAEFYTHEFKGCGVVQPVLEGLGDANVIVDLASASDDFGLRIIETTRGATATMYKFAVSIAKTTGTRTYKHVSFRGTSAQQFVAGTLTGFGDIGPFSIIDMNLGNWQAPGNFGASGDSVLGLYHFQTGAATYGAIKPGPGPNGLTYRNLVVPTAAINPHPVNVELGSGAAVVRFFESVWQTFTGHTGGDMILIPANPPAGWTVKAEESVVSSKGQNCAFLNRTNGSGGRPFVNRVVFVTTTSGAGNQQSVISNESPPSTWEIGAAGTGVKNSIVKDFGAGKHAQVADFDPDNTADQISNAGTGWNSWETGSPTPYSGVTNVGFTNPPTTDVEVVSIDLVDGDATLLTWDQSLGGPGTIASVNDRLSLKPALTADFWAYMRARYKTTNAGHQGAADDAGDIGLGVVTGAPKAVLAYHYQHHLGSMT